ncbi:MAG TPA: hypothetical protein VM347_19765, partial [Nonomuraea sp.]|nr:hypothetical protein [Nonomuraea sp.]
LAAAAVTLVEQPETLAAVRQEFDAREQGPGPLPAAAEPPRHLPPSGFLEETGQLPRPPRTPPVSAEPLGKI